MSSDDFNDELIRQAVAGDRMSLSKLLYLHNRPLARQLTRQLSASEKHLVSVEDVVQETYLRAFRDIYSCAARDDQTLANWLAAIANHQLANALKAARARKRGGHRVQTISNRSNPSSSLSELAKQLSDRGESPSSVAARHEAAAALHVGLASLPPDQRRAVELRYMEGRSESETADAMGKTQGAVHGLVFRARASMRELLGRSSRWFYRK